VQRPLSPTSFSTIYSFEQSLPTNPHNREEEVSRRAEGVFSFFLSGLRRLASSLQPAVGFVMREGIPPLAISLFLTTRASGMPLETYQGWDFHLWEEDFILVQRPGELDSQAELLTFVLEKNRCDRVVQLFELFTMTNHPDLERLLDTKVELRENGSPTDGTVIDVHPHKSGHIVLINMGHYRYSDIRDYYDYHQRFRVTITSHQLTTPLDTLFDLPTKQWSIPHFQEALDRAYDHCLKIPDPRLVKLSHPPQKGLKP